MSDYGSSYGIQSPLTQEELYRNRSQSRMTALRYAWIGEKCSPELLPYQANLVEHVQREIAAYQARLDNDEVVQQLTTVIQIEIDRARFVLASYLRTRLAKIQKFATYVTTEPKAQQRLSPAELEFARGYRALMADHFNAAFLKDIPEKYRSLDGRDSMAEPNTNGMSIVFIC